MAKQAVIYARVSTEEQAEKGYSLPSQLEACRKYAAANGYIVVAEEKDDYSGATLDRPGLERLRAIVKRGQAKAVIVYDPDRLSRDDVDFLVICREWERAGVALHFVNGGELPNTPEGDILRYLMGWKGKRERKDILERTTRGRRTKAQSGQWVGIGFAPYGYKRTGKGKDAKLIVYEKEARVVRLIFQWYTRGDGKHGPISLRSIALALGNRGEPTPGHRKNSAEYWIPATIRGILCNEIYAGRTYYGKTQVVERGGTKKRMKQPRENWISVDVPELAIVDRKTWEVAQVRFARNKELARRNQKHEYLMTGFFRCAACKSAMAGSSSLPNGYETIYYRCGNHWHRPDKPPCSNSGRTIVSHRVDNMVWEWLSKLISDDEELDQKIRAWRERNAEELEPKRERLKAVCELLVKAQRRTDRLAQSYGEAAEEEDETTAEALKHQLKIASKSRDALAEERAALEAQLARIELTPEREAAIKAAVRGVRGRIGGAKFEQKRELFDMFILQVRFRVDETGRWLDVSCELTGAQVFELPLSSESFLH